MKHFRIIKSGTKNSTYEVYFRFLYFFWFCKKFTSEDHRPLIEHKKLEFKTFEEALEIALDYEDRALYRGYYIFPRIKKHYYNDFDYKYVLHWKTILDSKSYLGSLDYIKSQIDKQIITDKENIRLKKDKKIKEIIYEK